VHDFFPLAKFLNVPVFSGLEYFNQRVARPLFHAVTRYAHDPGARARALAPLQVLLSGIMMRRTFATVDARTGRPLLALPPRTNYAVGMVLSEVERRVYDAVFRGASVRLQALAQYNPARQVDAGGAGAGAGPRLSKAELRRRQFATAYEMLMRCRQACCHVNIMISAMQRKRALVNAATLAGDDAPAERVPLEVAARIAAEELQRRTDDFVNHLGERLERLLVAGNAAAPAGGKKATKKGRKAAAAAAAAGAEALPMFVRTQLDAIVAAGGKVEGDCIVCLEPMRDPAMLLCGHTFCYECIQRLVENFHKCSVCKRDARPTDIIHIAALAEVKDAAAAAAGAGAGAGDDDDDASNDAAKVDIIDRILVGEMNTWPMSVKAQALVGLLATFPSDETHVIVFSQFLTFLDYLRCALAAAGHETALYCGSLSAGQRQSVLADFSRPLPATADEEGLAARALSNFVQPPVPRVAVDDGSATADPAEAAAAAAAAAGAGRAVAAVAGLVAGMSAEAAALAAAPAAPAGGDEVPAAAANADAPAAAEPPPPPPPPLPFHRKKVLLATVQTCGVGVTITAATRCILLEPCWNASVEEQAVSRCHRIGQARPVHVYRLSVDETVEVDIAKLSRAKGEFADLCLSRTGSGARNIGLADLLQLFGVQLNGAAAGGAAAAGQGADGAAPAARAA
jgi:SNF2 family DNA or RNA helicase